MSVAIIALSCVIVYQGYLLFSYYRDLRANENTAARAAAIFDNITPLRSTAPPSTQRADRLDATPTAEPEPTEQPILPVILALREEFGNDDIIGYISIEDTNIKYPVVQTTDNDFYISHSVDKKANAGGAVFMDRANAPALTDVNTVIYGHNMRNRSMFHDLRYYTGSDFFHDHQIIRYTTLYEETTWEVFAFYPTRIDFNYIQTSFASADDVAAFIKAISLRSVVETSVEVSSDDAILTLSTCTNTADNMRYALHAKLIDK